MERRGWLGRGLLILAVVASGCGGDPADPDAGPPPDDAGETDAGIDAGATDESSPTITSSRPRAGEEGVLRTASLELRFSEPVDPESGDVTVTGPDGAIALDARVWGDEGDVLTVSATSGWPGGARIDVTATDFADAAGNVQTEDFALVFHTSDDGPPSVLSVTPTEGATDVAVDPLTVSIVFSEPMNPLLGTLTLDGAELGEAAWSSETELRVAITALEHGTDYRLGLAGFEDRSANELDPAPVLGDGALDFRTVPDTTAPTVVDSNPTHEQLDVDVARFTAIRVTFDEPMDTSVRTAPYTAGATVGTLTGNWSLDGRTIRFDVTDRLVVDAEHRVDLSAFSDEAGNALDGASGLDAGALVFTSSASDERIPFVVFSTPVEGADDVSTRLSMLRVLFSEAMDTSVTALVLDDGAASVTLEGTWNDAGTELRAPLSGLASMQGYRVDLSGFTDVSGNALDAAHAYLVDGALDFATGQPSGESCADPLTTAEATPDGDGFVWELFGGQFTRVDGQPSCSSSSVYDGVIAFEKTTGDLASGGRALRITAESADAFNGVQLEVYRDVCDPEAVGGGAAAREICLTQRRRWTQYLDVPAGTYFVWVANEYAASTSPSSDYPFEGATVRIEEVDSIPEGESCGDPYDVSSSIYSSPSVGEHQWIVPGSVASSSDYGTSTRGEGSMSCVSGDHGPDAVIRVDKLGATSILDVTVEPFPAETGTGVFNRAGTHVEVLDRCDSRDAGVASLSCPGRVLRPEGFQLAGDAGAYWLWLAANNSEVEMVQTTVRVREVEPQLGETCATAIPLTPGAGLSITPDSSERFFAPSCAPSTGGITWYRYTTTKELSVVSLGGAAQALALIDPSTGAEIGCLDEGNLVGFPRRAPAGAEVCVAVPSDPSITSITIQELDWQGVDGGTRTDLNIQRPVDGAGAELTITGESWLEVSEDQLYLGIQVSSLNTTTNRPAIVVAPRSGGERADRILVDRYEIGYAATLVDGALFSVDETNAAARPNRLFRHIDSSGGIAATAWDTGSGYIGMDIDSLTRILGEDLFLMATDSSASVATTFYTVPLDGGAALPIGASAHLTNVTALAATTEWIFAGGTGPEGSGVYRLPRADVSALPVLLTQPDLATVNATNGSMVYDATRDIVYFRSAKSPDYGVYAVFAASSEAPVFGGAVAVIGRSADYGLAIDESIPALFVFETETNPDGAFTEIR